jgi:hypothetical protein
MICMFIRVRCAENKYSSRDQTVRFAYITSLRVERKQTHVQTMQTIQTMQTRDNTDTGTETMSHKLLPLGCNIFRMDSICFLLCYPSLIPLPFTSDGRGTHRFIPTNVSEI